MDTYGFRFVYPRPDSRPDPQSIGLTPADIAEDHFTRESLLEEGQAVRKQLEQKISGQEEKLKSKDAIIQRLQKDIERLQAQLNMPWPYGWGVNGMPRPPPPPPPPPNK